MNKLNIVIAGGRDFNDYEMLEATLYSISEDKDWDNTNTAIVCGEARGADALGREFAEKHGIEVISMPADWDKHGKSAGYKRNAEMVAIADHVVCFWDGKSKGTANTIALAKQKGIGLDIIMY